MINIHSVIPQSKANGPGTRFTIWFQGCSLGCEGCFNPETHSSKPNLLISVDELIAQIISLDDKIEGISISGGEPFQQQEELLKLVMGIRKQTDLSILLFSGLTIDEIKEQSSGHEILSNIDVLIDGRYIPQRHLGKGLLGSSNQKIHLLTGRCTIDDIEATPEVEVIINPDGSLTISGIYPLNNI
jgi:anaerobic ribonucleoside-triphosphate reductase activating protein